MIYTILLGIVLFTSTPAYDPLTPTKEATVKLDCKKDFRQWASKNLCPRKKYSIEDIRLVDMDHDRRYDVFIVTKESAHLCMLCATSISQNYFLCDYCADQDLRKTISHKKHMAYHDTVQVNYPDTFGYKGYFFFQQPNGRFKFCNCEILEFGDQYNPKSILINEAMGFVSHFFDYPTNTRDRYVYKWNKRTKQLELF